METETTDGKGNVRPYLPSRIEATDEPPPCITEGEGKTLTLVPHLSKVRHE